MELAALYVLKLLSYRGKGRRIFLGADRSEGFGSSSPSPSSQKLVPAHRHARLTRAPGKIVIKIK
jgi:hypothetical protein